MEPSAHIAGFVRPPYASRAPASTARPPADAPSRFDRRDDALSIAREPRQGKARYRLTPATPAASLQPLVRYRPAPCPASSRLTCPATPRHRAALAAAGGGQSSLGSGDAGALRHRRRLQAAPPTLPACQQQLTTMSGKFRTCNTQKTSCTNQLATARDDASKAVANATVLATQLKAEKANSSRLGKDLTQCKANATSLDSQLRCDTGI